MTTTTSVWHAEPDRYTLHWPNPDISPTPTPG